MTTFFGLIFLAVTAVWGYAVVETKKIKNTNTFQISFHLGLSLLFSSAFFYPLFPHTATVSQILMAVLLQGIPMAITQLLFIGAFVISDQHGRISVMIFSQVLTAYFISIFRYHEPVKVIGLGGTLLAIYGVGKCVLNKS